jgi:hypothetical protein
MKFNLLVFNKFKKQATCFLPFYNRKVKVFIYVMNNFLLYNFNLFQNKQKKNKSSITIESNTSSLFNDVNLEFFNQNNFKYLNYVWYLIKKIYQKKCFVFCKMLKITFGGFILGCLGFIGFLPKLYTIIKNFKVSIFFILSIDYLGKIYFSQKKLSKLCLHIFLKLSNLIKYKL